MATKKPSVKKSAKSASATTTMTATLVPAKPWHSRGAVAIVLVVVIAVLAVGFALTGAALNKTVNRLRDETATLRAEVTRLSTQAEKAQRDLSQSQAARPDLSRSAYGLQQIAKSSRTGAAYFIWFRQETEDPADGSPILRLHPTSHVFNQLQNDYGLGYFKNVSANQTLLATFYKSATGVLSLGILDLDVDKVVTSYQLPTGKNFCNPSELGTTSEITWISQTTVRVKLCYDADPKREEFVQVKV